MDYILSKYCPRIEFDSYEDFYDNFKIDVPENFNFAYDVVDEWARVEPDKKALVWINDAGEEREFTFTDISLLSNRAANAFKKLGIRKGDVVMMMLRRRWEYWVCAMALCKIGASIIPATIQLTSKDIAYRANSAAVKMLICVDDDYVVEQVEGALPNSTTSCSSTSRVAPRAMPRPWSTASSTRSGTSSPPNTGSKYARTACTCP